MVPGRVNVPRRRLIKKTRQPQILPLLKASKRHWKRRAFGDNLRKTKWRRERYLTAIWSNGEDGAWRLLGPKGFPDEATLHTMVEQAPQMLPLAGAPSLTVVGREVQLGSGYADLIAIEPTGRLAVIEVKLARNAEARRAVVAQVLTYAAFLRGLTAATLEQQTLTRHLSDRGYASLVDAARSSDQTGDFDEAAFSNGLDEALRRGRFRLVFVLDEAPAELVRLVGYLEAVTDGLIIDLVTVSAYEVNHAKIIVPQRVDPEHSDRALPAKTVGVSSAVPPQSVPFTEGADEFLASVEQAAAADQPLLRMMADWALELEKRGLVVLGTYHGTVNRWRLLPRVPNEGVGLVTLWNEKGTSYVQFWRSVFLRRAPNHLAELETLVAPATVGKGTTTRQVTPELLDLLTRAYEEAAGGVVLQDQSL